MTRTAIGTPGWGDDLNEDLDGIEAKALDALAGVDGLADQVAALPATLAPIQAEVDLFDEDSTLSLARNGGVVQASLSPDQASSTGFAITVPVGYRPLKNTVGFIKAGATIATVAVDRALDGTSESVIGFGSAITSGSGTLVWITGDPAPDPS